MKGLDDLTLIQKGGWVRVVGRLRVRKWVSQDNEERSSIEIPARLVEVIPRGEDLEPMQPQRDY